MFKYSCCFAAPVSFFSFDQVEKAAARHGIILVDRCSGPILRVDALVSGPSGATPTNGQLRRVGSVNGWSLRPLFRRAHVESLKVNRVDQVAVPRCTGRLLSVALCCKARERGCSVAYFLAIDDGPERHRKLLRYFRALGFRSVRRIDDQVGDRLIWGGCGTLMCAEVDEVLQKWRGMIL